MRNLLCYPVQINDFSSSADKCLCFRPTEVPFKQRLAFVHSVNGINLLLPLRAERNFRGLISTGNFWGSRCSAPPRTSSRMAGATEGPPIKMPSGPCWPPDKHMPRMHHVGGRSVPFNSTSSQPLHLTVSSCFPNAPSLKQTYQSIQLHFFFVACVCADKATL